MNRLELITSREYWVEMIEHTTKKGFTDIELADTIVSKMEDVLKFEYKKGVQTVYPAHWMVKNWVFTEDEHAEATLAHAMATVAEKNGMSANDLSHLFPALLRMLKSDTDWAK